MIEIVRKYRGHLRIVPVRAAIVAAVREGDGDVIRQAEERARKDGFVQLAAQAQAEADRLEGIVRCESCGRPGHEGFRGNDCAACKERWRAEKRASSYGSIKRSEPRVQQAQHRRLTGCDFRRRQSGADHPWRLVEKTGKRPRGVKSYEWRKYHHVLQRSWEHLRGQLPDMNRQNRWTEAEFELHGRLVREELARRRGAKAA